VITQVGNNVVEWAMDAFWTNHKINTVKKAYADDIAAEEEKLLTLEGDDLDQ